MFWILKPLEKGRRIFPVALLLFSNFSVVWSLKESNPAALVSPLVSPASFKSASGERGQPPVLNGEGATARLQTLERTNLTHLPEKPILVVRRTAEGSLLGVRVDNKVNRPYLAFKGIPYAQPPVGDLRLQSPEEFPPWKGIKLAVAFKNPCIAFSVRVIIGKEDCLYLNVFVPNQDVSEFRGKTSQRRRHVVFWIHGGALIHGGELIPTLYSPGTFTDRGFIFVTIGYRLGPLGFLSTGDEVIPGNFGFKDMVMGLKWVQRNIANFGGDPRSVHIMGQSAGGVSVHALTLSPMAQGLFKTAISMSGSIFVPWGLNSRGKKVADHVSRSLGCGTESSSLILKCLKQKPAKEITATIEEFFSLGVRYALPYGLVVDRHAEDPFMPDHPLNIISQRKFQAVPHIFGTVPEEMALFIPTVTYDRKQYDIITRDWDSQCGRLAYSHLYIDGTHPGEEETAPFCRRARKLYFGNGPIDPPGDNARKLVKVASDVMIRAGVHMSALLQSKFGYAPVYLYSWDHKNEGALNLLNLINMMYDSETQSVITNATDVRQFRVEAGKSHADDLFLLFDPPNLVQRLTNQDVAVKSFIMAMFGSFWTSGTPTADGVEWPEFDQHNQEHVVFEYEPEITDLLITPSKLRLFSDWYDLYHEHQRRQLSFPSMSALLFDDDNARLPEVGLSRRIWPQLLRIFHNFSG